MKFFHIGFCGSMLSGASHWYRVHKVTDRCMRRRSGACLDLYVSYPAGTATGYDLEDSHL